MYDLTDHLPNFLVINKLIVSPGKTKIFKRDYSKLNETRLVEEVCSVKWEKILPKTNDPSEIFNSFHSELTRIIDKPCSYQKAFKKRNQK